MFRAKLYHLRYTFRYMVGIYTLSVLVLKCNLDFLQFNSSEVTLTVLRYTRLRYCKGDFMYHSCASVKTCPLRPKEGACERKDCPYHPLHRVV